MGDWRQAVEGLGFSMIVGDLLLAEKNYSPNVYVWRERDDQAGVQRPSHNDCLNQQMGPKFSQLLD